MSWEVKERGDGVTDLGSGDVEEGGDGDGLFIKPRRFGHHFRKLFNRDIDVSESEVCIDNSIAKSVEGRKKRRASGLCFDSSLPKKDLAFIEAQSSEDSKLNLKPCEHSKLDQILEARCRGKYYDGGHFDSDLNYTDKNARSGGGSTSYNSDSFNANAAKRRDREFLTDDGFRGHRGVAGPAMGMNDRRGVDESEQKESRLKFDRFFYDGEDGMNTVDFTSNSFLEDEERGLGYENEPEKRFLQKNYYRAKSMNESTSQWEEDRLLASGVVQRTRVKLASELEMETDVKINLIVSQAKPPFLFESVTYSKISQPIMPVKDPTSDMAVLSRKGSRISRETREQKERLASMKKFWEMSRKKLNSLMGIDGEGESASDASPKSLQSSNGNLKSRFMDSIIQQGPELGDEGKRMLIKSQRESLPVFACKNDLINLIRENNIVIVVGETGSGKTTQMTQYLYEYGFASRGRIGCTQPRRVAAMSVAKRVSEEIGVELGMLVGYTIRFEDCTSEKTKIRYMTDGVLVRESLKDPDLDQYSVIIMDEAHERALNTDILFGILKKIAQRRNDIKLIITSATMDAQRFSKFFGNVPIFHIPGRTFPVEKIFTANPVQDYVEEAVNQALRIHVGSREGDILIFMTGQEDVEMTCLLLQEGMKKLGDKVKPMLILPMYSQLPADLQSKIFEKTQVGIRKAIVSTNVAETSLTVDGIYFVIDSGFIKLKIYNPVIGMDALQVFPVSKASADQRAGRAGRTGPGVCYRLYTSRIYNEELLLTTVPEIQRTHLANVILLLKSIGVENLMEFDFMDPPPQENIAKSLYHLWVLGALDDWGKLTAIGRKMSEFPLDPSLSKMLIMSEFMKCSDEVVTIVSMLSVPSVFIRPKEKPEESDSIREKFMVPESDHLTLLFVYQQWSQNGYSAKWCQENYIQFKAMKKIQEIRNQLIDILRSNKMKLISCNGKWDYIRKTICSAYFQNAAKMKGLGQYITLMSGVVCSLHPTSALFDMGYIPEYVVYHELIKTKKEYLQYVTAVDPHWLAELGPMFYSIKDQYDSNL